MSCRYLNTIHTRNYSGCYYRNERNVRNEQMFISSTLQLPSRIRWINENRIDDSAGPSYHFLTGMPLVLGELNRFNLFKIFRVNPVLFKQVL